MHTDIYDIKSAEKNWVTLPSKEEKSDRVMGLHSSIWRVLSAISRNVIIENTMQE